LHQILFSPFYFFRRRGEFRPLLEMPRQLKHRFICVSHRPFLSFIITCWPITDGQVLLAYFYFFFSLISNHTSSLSGGHASPSPLVIIGRRERLLMKSMRRYCVRGWCTIPFPSSCQVWYVTGFLLFLISLVPLYDNNGGSEKREGDLDAA